MKSKNKILLFVLFLTHYQENMYAQEDLNSEQGIEADFFDYNPEMGRIAEEATETTVTRGTKTDTIEALTTLASAHELLQHQLYFRTNPLGRRNIIDLPIFQSFSKFIPQTQVSCLPFYAQTYKKYFYAEYDALSRYIDIKQDHLIKKLDDLEFVTFDIPETLELFENIKVQERRFGFMFNWSKSNDCWAASARLPLYYLERNFYLNSSERAAIEKHPLFAGAYVVDAEKFAYEHLVSDRIGLGDAKINFEYLIKNTDKYQLSLGTKITIPTAFRLGKGFLGSYFDVNKKAPDFDLHSDLLEIDFTTSAGKERVKNNAIGLAVDVLDRLSTILLQQNTGNNHHLGIGLFSHSTMFFNEKVNLSSLTSVEALLPAHEQRFFIAKNDPAAFAAFNWDDDTVEIDEKLAFLNAQLKEKFFPPGYDTVVFPGFIFQNTSALTYKAVNWDLILGSDFWWQTKEHFLTIDAPSEISPRLQKETAKRGYIYQTGLWIAAQRHPLPGSEWQFGLKVGKTTLSRGIGQDVSFAFHIENFF